MTLPLPVAMLTACAPMVASETTAAVVRVESGGNPLAVNINNGPRVEPQSLAEAVQIATAAIAKGYKVDIGLMQVDSANFAALGVTVTEMFNPCANLRAGGTILAADYMAATQRAEAGLPALKLALSAYNTGDFERGFQNGYVARYFGEPAIPPVTLDPYTAPTQVFARVTLSSPGPGAPANPYTAPAQVYERSPDHASTSGPAQAAPAVK